MSNNKKDKSDGRSSSNSARETAPRSARASGSGSTASNAGRTTQSRAAASGAGRARNSASSRAEAEKVRAAARKQSEASYGYDDNEGGGKGAVIAVFVTLALLCVLLVGAGFYVSNLETVYPKVSMEGVELGGMTQREAELALSDTERFSEYDDSSVTVELPTDCTLTITADQAGVYSGASGAAQLAYDYGRGGNMITNLISYAKCLMSGAELSFASEFSIDEDGVRALISESADSARQQLVNSQIDIREDSIAIVKGAGSIEIDEDEIYDLVVEAFRENKSGTLNYTPKTEEDEVDFGSIYDSVYKEPVSAVYDAATGGATQSENGLSFDIDEARRLWSEAESGEEIIIPLIMTYPDVTTEELNASLFADCLSKKSTSLGGSSSARINNITKAAASINGIVMNPGDEFSYNETLGQRTAAAGYQPAGAYANGKNVTEYGGGICQVSSTLYYCTLYANLEITQRLCHYFSVSYLPAGLDATVSWPSPDFQFKNNRDYPIKIEAYTDMSSYTVTVEIWGTDVDGSTVQVTTETWATANGTGATSYRLVYDKDGNLISKTKESDSQYHIHEPETTPSPSPSPSPSTTPSETPNTPTDPPTNPPEPSNPVEPPPEIDPPVTDPPPVIDPPAGVDPPPVVDPPVTVPDPVPDVPVTVPDAPPDGGDVG